MESQLLKEVSLMAESEGLSPSNTQLDLTVALARVGGQMDLLKEIGQLFLEDYPNSLRQIREARDRSDAKLLDLSAHSLKGAVCNFGAPEIVALAADLEHKGRRGDLSSIDEPIARLERALASLHSELESL